MVKMGRSIREIEGTAKLHCGREVLYVQDFGCFFFMCNKCDMISNFFSNDEHPDNIAHKRIQFRKVKGK